MYLHVDDLVVSSRTARVRDKNAFVRIWRGVYLPTGAVPKGAPAWQIRRLIAEARALSISLIMDSDNPPVLTGESALVLYDIDTWWNTPDVMYRRQNHRVGRAKQVFPTVTIHGVVVPEARLIEIAQPSAATTRIVLSGVLVEPLGMVAIDCAGWLHPLSAVVAVSGILRRMSQFDKRRIKQSRAAEREARETIVNHHEGWAGKRNYRQERAVLEVADAGVESPGEGAVLWAVHCIVDGSQDRSVVTQQRVSLPEGSFYGDIAIPSCKTIVEFDGYSKVSEKGKERTFINRQRQILAAGWTMIRIELRQLQEPDPFIWQLVRELREAGVSASMPSGPLWRPIPSELVGLDRRS